MKLSIHFLYSTFFSTARNINCYEVKWTYYVHELLNLWILKRFIFVKTFGLVKCNNLVVVITQSIEYCSHPTGLLFREVLWYYQVTIRKGKKLFSVIFPKEHLKNAKLNWGKRIYSLESLQQIHLRELLQARDIIRSRQAAAFLQIQGWPAQEVQLEAINFKHKFLEVINFTRKYGIVTNLALHEPSAAQRGKAKADAACLFNYDENIW